MIQVNDVTKAFDTHIVFENFSLSMANGEYLAITGPSGCGKSTLLNIIGQLEPPTAGEVVLDDERMDTPKQRMLFYRHKAGYLFQNFALIEEQTVYDNLAIAMAYQKATQKEKKEKMCAALQTVGLPEALNTYVYQMSGGEQQRLALVRLLLKEPKYIFADEPTGNLDAANRDLVLNLLKGLKDKGATILMATHDLAILKRSEVDRTLALQ
ncbi:MAG: ATP-binding cassette domain-containing protein [Gemmiger sp.]|nr:ATP-binding cassette domain-containing protein [Gemmiger sp.]